MQNFTREREKEETINIPLEEGENVFFLNGNDKLPSFDGNEGDLR